MTEALVVAVVLLVAATYKWWRLAGALAASHDGAAKVAIERDEALSQVESLSTCLRGTSHGLLVVSGEGRVLTKNPAASSLIGLRSDEGHEGHLESVVHWPELHGALRELVKDGQPRSLQMETSTPQVRSLDVRLEPLATKNVLITIEDMSLLKRLESLRRDFVANVSHELKTPLAAIKGFVETIQDDSQMPAEIRRRFLDRVHQQTERLSSLVSDLLALSRLDDDPHMQSGDPCDLLAVISDTSRDLLPIAEQREIQLDQDLPTGSLWVRADRESLRQMVGNLVDNALKYTPERGTVTIRMTTAGGRCRLEVADTGIGLSQGDQERIFERFYRVDRARSRELGGTGLGLSIVKNTVLSLGGEIGVSSELGVGSMFWIELPLCP